MLNRLFPIIVPILAFATAITGIVGIGSLLLAVGTQAAVVVALALTVAIGVGGALLAYRASKLPPAPWPDPGPMAPVRRLDLGAGYLVGQFVLIFGVGLLLLFLILVLS